MIACPSVPESPSSCWPCRFSPSRRWPSLRPSPDAPPVSNAPAQPDDDQPVATFKLQVNLVDLFFTVKDKNGKLVPHLTKSDCSVMEDKQPQT